MPYDSVTIYGKKKMEQVNKYFMNGLIFVLLNSNNYYGKSI